MKRLPILLFSIALVFTSCDDKKKGLSAEYDELMTQGDSIEVAHQEFMTTHNKMADMHQKFTEQLSAMEIEDLTLLEDIAKHDVILKRHDAIIESHAELFEAHKTFKSEFDAMTDVEMQSKIEEMKNGHEKIRNEHAEMESEHDMIMSEHKAIEKKLMQTESEDSEEY